MMLVHKNKVFLSFRKLRLEIISKDIIIDYYETHNKKIIIGYHTKKNIMFEIHETLEDIKSWFIEEDFNTSYIEEE